MLPWDQEVKEYESTQSNNLASSNSPTVRDTRRNRDKPERSLYLTYFLTHYDITIVFIYVQQFTLFYGVTKKIQSI